MSSYQPPADSFGNANQCDPATVDYFIKIFGAKEAVELSNIDNPTKNSIDAEKIQIALNDSATLIGSYISTAPYQGKLLIMGSYRRTQATLARCYLDSLRPRKAVLDACEKALQQLELWSSKAQPTAALRFQEARSYWGDTGCFTRATYARGRDFTEPSMIPWRTLNGANARRNNFVPPEPNVYQRHIIDNSCSAPDPNDLPQIDPSLQELNDLVSVLENTRGMGNFDNTLLMANGDLENQNLMVANNEEEFDNTKIFHDTLTPEEP